ncbi:NADAR superfamily protein [Paraglaciecola Antarctic GD virus 1]|nr:NADAR superfamily protein [Paraglaciecola Antarctic GD virus 1]
MIQRFDGQYSFLSNFAPCVIEYHDMLYDSVEHAYVASKTVDLDLRLEIQSMSTAGKVKRFGRKLELRKGFDNLKYSIMTELIEKKFDQEDYKYKLLATGDQEIYEGNTWGDKYWGVEFSESGVITGFNNLGKIIMKKRLDMQNGFFKM